jgi:hypothetical protein
MANYPINNGVKKSIVKPTPHKMNRRGGGTNADTVQIAADIAKSIEYLFVNGLLEGIRYPTRIYSTIL